MKTIKIWLDGLFCLPSKNVFKIPEDLGIQPSTSNFGRPGSDFSVKSEKGKRVEVPALVSGYSHDKLAFATGVSLYKSGKRDAAAIFKNINEFPTKVTKIKKIVNIHSKEPVPYTDKEALRLFIDGKYTKAICTQSYHILLEAKQRSCPSNGIKVVDVIAEVSQKKRKYEIINALKSEMNSLIEIPEPGEGSTNDGNTARKYFKQPFLDSQITGVNGSLLKRLVIINNLEHYVIWLCN